MKAKETVMPDINKRGFRYILANKEERWDRWDVEGLLEHQAEISFKAGVKEVVDWAGENFYISPDNTVVEATRGIFLKVISAWVSQDGWQAKLKEWGVE